mmetsp:Transcript_48254/g.105004  ORF Transcript_48254/g.105004 Transcript_48254/m.105004 type:complete len:308 (+) Transcript_48254:49-972(+)
MAAGNSSNSSGKPVQTCVPCRFYRKSGRGCYEGAQCNFCHEDHVHKVVRSRRRGTRASGKPEGRVSSPATSTSARSSEGSAQGEKSVQATGCGEKCRLRGDSPGAAQCCARSSVWSGEWTPSGSAWIKGVLTPPSGHRMVPRNAWDRTPASTYAGSPAGTSKSTPPASFDFPALSSGCQAETPGGGQHLSATPEAGRQRSRSPADEAKLSAPATPHSPAETGRGRGADQREVRSGPPSPAPASEYVSVLRVAYDFHDPKLPTTMPITAGAMLGAFPDASLGWVFCRDLITGKTGWVPRSFTVLVMRC